MAHQAAREQNAVRNRSCAIVCTASTATPTFQTSQAICKQSHPARRINVKRRHRPTCGLGSIATRRYLRCDAAVRQDRLAEVLDILR